MIFISAEGDSAVLQSIFMGRTGGPPIVAVSCQWHAPAAVADGMVDAPVTFVRDRGGPEPYDVTAAYRNGFVQAVAVTGGLTWTRCDLWLEERYLGTIWLGTPNASPPRRPQHVKEENQ